MSHKINTLAEYVKHYENSVSDPEQFWENIAQTFTWQKPWDRVLTWDFDGPSVKWFENAQLNITENIFERHLDTQPDKTAILW